jgi:hypothetical protein
MRPELLKGLRPNIGSNSSFTNICIDSISHGSPLKRFKRGKLAQSMFDTLLMQSQYHPPRPVTYMGRNTAKISLK